MSRRRFYVATVSGYPIPRSFGRVRRSYPPGLTAHVLDRFLQHATLASYYSEDRTGTGSERLGVRGAIEEARKTARELNAWERAQ